MSEQRVGPPTGLTLMPAISPFSKNDLHASAQLGEPVMAVIPFSIILRTGSDWYAPLMIEPECWSRPPVRGMARAYRAWKWRPCYASARVRQPRPSRHI